MRFTGRRSTTLSGRWSTARHWPELRVGPFERGLVESTGRMVGSTKRRVDRVDRGLEQGDQGGGRRPLRVQIFPIGEGFDLLDQQSLHASEVHDEGQVGRAFGQR